MKLFSGDINGRVVCTEIDYTKVSFATYIVSNISDSGSGSCSVLRSLSLVILRVSLYG